MSAKEEEEEYLYNLNTIIIISSLNQFLNPNLKKNYFSPKKINICK
jgi:hypothetical protein